jgi:hypothetical protein
MRLIGSPTLLSVAFALAVAGIVPLHAANVKHMPLPELVARADRIVRGTVLAVDDTSVPVGVGTLSATVYRIRVAETLKGSAAPGEVIEVRLLAPPKTPRTGRFARGTLLQDLPRFDVGREYLFLLTRPSAIGLSTTVGLKQGLFERRQQPRPVRTGWSGRARSCSASRRASGQWPCPLLNARGRDPRAGWQIGGTS